MKIIARSSGASWVDTESILFVADGADAFQVEITRVTHGTLLQTPYAPDEYQSYRACLWTSALGAIVTVEQRTTIAGSGRTGRVDLRSYRSVDGGRVWQPTEAPVTPRMLDGMSAELIAELP